MPSPSDKPLPVADADSASFWDACALRGELVAQQCDACGRFRWPPRGVCPTCSAWSFTWQSLPLRGRLQSFVVPHRPFSPGFAEDVPYVVAHVVMDDTDGHVVLVSNLHGVAWPQVSVGLRVAVAFDARGLPYFTPIA